MKKLLAYLNLFRFELPFSAGVCTVLGQTFALGSFPELSLAAKGFGAIFFISASALILNDYFDVETDKINAPGRPLALGLISPFEVVSLFLVVSIIGFFLAFLIGIEALLLSVILWIIGILYNWKLKKSGIFGNIAVSFSVGMTFIFGGISVGIPFSILAWYFGILTAFINLGEEITADVMDMEGDREAGSKSIPIKYGRKSALNMSTIIFMTVIVLSIVPFLFKWFSTVYAVPVLIMNSIIIYSVVILRSSQREQGRKYIRMIYLGALFAALIILLLRIFDL